MSKKQAKAMSVTEYLIRQAMNIEWHRLNRQIIKVCATGTSADDNKLAKLDHAIDQLESAMTPDQLSACYARSQVLSRRKCT